MNYVIELFVIQMKYVRLIIELQFNYSTTLRYPALIIAISLSTSVRARWDVRSGGASAELGHTTTPLPLRGLNVGMPLLSTEDP